MYRKSIPPKEIQRKDFLCPKATYRGAVKPEQLVFNANLQEFAHQVGYISSLETNGKLSPEESMAAIDRLWSQLDRSWESLGIDESA